MDKNKLFAGMTKQEYKRNRRYELVRGKLAPGVALQAKRIAGAE